MCVPLLYKEIFRLQFGEKEGGRIDKDLGNIRISEKEARGLILVFSLSYVSQCGLSYI